MRWRSSLNDASLFYEPESSTALGFGFRCGFLGMLHMEIIQERLEREYDLDLITTAPTVVYEIELNDGSTIHIDSPAQMPAINNIREMREPIAECPHPAAAGVHRQRHHPLHREARRTDQHGLPRQAGGADLRDPDGGSGARLLRPSGVHQSRLRLPGLRLRASKPPTWSVWTS